MSYVDGFVFAVPEKKVAAYKRIATKAGKVWMEHGALAYWECLGDDLPKAKKGSVTFPGMVQAKRGELVGFSWIVYKSRAHRDKVTKKVLADPRLAAMMKPEAMPFDMKRMAYGGFEKLVSF